MIRGSVACGHAETAHAAMAVLDDGGNAFDAALAGMCVTCIAEPVLASMGGGGFLLARPANGRHQGRTMVFDFFPQTPKRRRPLDDVDFRPVLADFGATQQEFHIGMGSIATPGLVKGLFDIHKELGLMPMRRIVEPAMTLARRGIRIESMQAYMISVVSAILASGEGSRALFASPLRPDELISEGEVLAMPEFADVLETVAIEGADLFYRGEIARRLCEDCAGEGGYLTLSDLQDYRVERRRPLTLDIFDARLHLNPPPSTGGILIAFALELLRETRLGGMAFGGAAHLECLAKTMQLTNRARVESRLHELEAEAAENLLHPAFLAAYRDRVLGVPLAPRGTTQISVVDAEGNAAALSISNGEGSGYVIPGTGIHLNNVLGEDDINPHGFHRWPTDVRLSSMMSPTLVIDREGGTTALGSGGSNRIRTAILQVLLNFLVFRKRLAEAVAAPRLHVEDDQPSIEAGFAESAVNGLARAFPDLRRWPEKNLFFGGVHAARREGRGALYGAGDERRGGVALSN